MDRAPNPGNIKIALVGILTLAALVIVGIFITDWYFRTPQTRLLDGALGGVLLGGAIGWVGGVITFYFATKDNGKDDD